MVGPRCLKFFLDAWNWAEKDLMFGCFLRVGLSVFGLFIPV